MNRSKLSALFVCLLTVAAVGTLPAFASGSRRVRHPDQRLDPPSRYQAKLRRTRANSRLVGTSMPAGPLPGWREVFTDDFKGSTLDMSKWRLYEGQPGGDPGAWFDPSHVYVANGNLVIGAYRDPADGGKFATGGVSSSPGLVQTYGKYLVRMRFDNGVGVSHIVLLWPADNSWPPEIDFSEDNATGSATTYATLHYGPNDTQVQKKLNVDVTRWHVYGVEWTPGKLAFTIDGRTWATVSGAGVPSIPMTLDIQTQSWACGVSTWEGCVGAVTPSRVNLYVDWVVAYKPA